MALGQQAEHHKLHLVVLALDDCLNVGNDPANGLARRFCLVFGEHFVAEIFRFQLCNFVHIA